MFLLYTIFVVIWVAVCQPLIKSDSFDFDLTVVLYMHVHHESEEGAIILCNFTTCYWFFSPLGKLADRAMYFFQISFA